MSTIETPKLSTEVHVEHLDVVIVGAGMSGVGAAYYVQTSLPDKTYAILEAREAFGGTWDLFKYPGIRSDSDLHTYGFAFKPWTGDQSIADGGAIMDYISETVAENAIDEHTRFSQRVTKAEWDTDQGLWTLDVEQVGAGETRQMTCSWLFCASGYYRYDKGYLPEFKGTERFQGQIIHPQQWPQDLNYAGKKIVVIGSGATAVTLVPAMATDAEHVTMLQRSPTYVVAVPEKDVIANFVKRHLPADKAYSLVRRRNIWLQKTIFQLSRKYPSLVKRAIRWQLKRQLPSGYDIDAHFTPDYNPWDQRLCSVPDGDLFKAISDGTASVITDNIDTFTEAGLLLQSGKELEADIIITATGLDVELFGGVDMIVDGEPVNVPDHYAYKGSMLSDVPNFNFAIGYTNSSWTLKIDLVCQYMCRLIEQMDRSGANKCLPVGPKVTMSSRPLLDFGAGYVTRAAHLFPKQGVGQPWELTMTYWTDVKRLNEPVMDGIMKLSGSSRAVQKV